MPTPNTEHYTPPADLLSRDYGALVDRLAAAAAEQQQQQEDNEH